MKPREKMLQEITRDFELTSHLSGINRPSAKVFEAMSKVPRESFVPKQIINAAYANEPQLIGHGQTISQPFIVALMTELLCPQASHHILEIGTGSGYQAAVLAGLVKEIVSIEVIPELAKTAEKHLKLVGIKNVKVVVGDGRIGFEEKAPYDGIIVTAASSDIPPSLVKQLKPGGKLVIPLNTPEGFQVLTLINKIDDNTLQSKDILPVRFVPLVHQD